MSVANINTKKSHQNIREDNQAGVLNPSLESIYSGQIEKLYRTAELWTCRHW